MREGEKPPYRGFLFFVRTDILVCSLIDNLTPTLSLKRRGKITVLKRGQDGVLSLLKKERGMIFVGTEQCSVNRPYLRSGFFGQK